MTLIKIHSTKYYMIENDVIIYVIERNNNMKWEAKKDGISLGISYVFRHELFEDLEAKHG